MKSVSRFFVLLCLWWSMLFYGTDQLQPSQRQVLLQLRKQLEYPKPLDFWINSGVDLCLVPSPQVNITCLENDVVGIRVFGNMQRKPPSFNGFPVPDLTLSGNFSMDSLIATLSRLNNLRSLTLVSLGIWGPFPEKIHRFQSLQYLDLSWNFLYGSIPTTLPRVLQLQLLKADGNFLNGTLPDMFDSFLNLTSLSLSNNGFSGALPSSVQRIRTLTDVNLSNNRISGELLDLTSLSNLRWVDLSNNELDSKLPSMPESVITLLLSNNSFSGRIPDQYGKLNRLQRLDLSYNALTETPLTGLFSLPDLTSLNLASNMLSGSLAAVHLSCGSKLQLVDISNNRLRGHLPPCLSSNVKSRVVKFGGNCLVIDLQHQHPDTYCSEIPQEKKKSSLGVLIGVIGGIGVVVVVLAVGFRLLCRQYCPGGTSEQHLLKKAVVVDNSVTGYTAEILTNARYISDAAKIGSQGSPPHRPFSLDELKAATNNFDSSTLMGEGSTGKIYKGRLENGTLVAIRCLTVSRKYTIRNLKLRLDLLSKLRHTHLVCFLGHCIESEGKNEPGANNVFLIYEYVQNGNYRTHLSETNPEKVLRWPDRLSILIGIAKAVHFLHTGIIPGFYSNRLKSNNILLNEHRMGKLSDYGLSVVAQETNKEEEDGLKSWQVKSLEDDIYSFGIILVESLVGPSVRARTEAFIHKEMVCFLAKTRALINE